MQKQDAIFPKIILSLKIHNYNHTDKVALSNKPSGTFKNQIVCLMKQKATLFNQITPLTNLLATISNLFASVLKIFTTILMF
ncbi:MAG: hypothetical protein NZM09_06145 [Ignavibacterium sp.]|nr:hypothetical protein [Ignavibacterium sp.]MDW8375260.1 hypothetical protein [Ignavibacteriales bacterium]